MLLKSHCQYNMVWLLISEDDMFSDGDENMETVPVCIMINLIKNF